MVLLFLQLFQYFSTRKKLKNSTSEMAIIPRTINIDTLGDTSAKCMNLHTITKYNENFSKTFSKNNVYFDSFGDIPLRT